MRRFQSHQGGDDSPDGALAGEEVQYLGQAEVQGGGDEWRITINMRDWSRPLHDDAEDIEITAKVLFGPSGDGALPPVRLTIRMDLVAAPGAGPVATVFGAFSSRISSAAEIYYHLLRSAMAGADTSHRRPSVADVASLHRGLLAFVSTGVPAVSPIMLDGALAALTLFASKRTHDAFAGDQLGLHLLCMVGQLVERFFHGRRDDYQHRIGEIESFQQRQHLVRRCQVMCGPIADSFWDFIQSVDVAVLAAGSPSNDFSTTRLLRMGALFLFNCDVHALVPCYRSISCPVAFNDFSGAAAVTTNAYNSAFYDWNLVARLYSIRPEHAAVMRLFSSNSNLLAVDRETFIAEVFRSFTSCRRVVEHIGNTLQILDVLTGKWDVDFAPAFTISTKPGSLLEMPLLYSDYQTHERIQAQEISGSIALRVRKICVEARYNFGGLCELLDATMQVLPCTL